MKTYSYSYLFSLFCLLAFCGCEQEKPYGSKGAFTVTLIDDLTNVAVTKSTPIELGKPLSSQFTLRIQDAQTGGSIYSGLCDRTYYEVPPATYDFFASYGTNPDLAFDAPYYEGELKNQTIGSTGKNVIIPCAVANALVSVRYTNPAIFDGVFTSYGIVATVGENSLEWPSADSRKSIYLKAGSSVSLVFKGVLKIGNEEVSFPIEQGLPDAYKAKDHYTIRLSYQAGQSMLNITTERKEATINETVPQDWLPKPSSASVNFANNLLVMKETMSPNAIVDLKVARPLQDLKFKLELEDPNLRELNKEYTLSALSEAEKETLRQAGISLPALGSTEPSVDFSELTGKLQTMNGGQTVNNYIYINPKANNRWNAGEGENGEKYTIQVEKPEFKVSVSAGNIWTKEFTLDEVSVVAGNPDVIKKQLRYQYSDDDGLTWVDCNKERQHQFQEHPLNKDYKVRALYRGEIASGIEYFSLEVQEQFPNADMEGWSTGKANAGSLLYYYPWSGGTSSFWDTNNEFTMRYSVTWFPSAYNRFPAVSFTRSSRSGSFAAELRNTAAGPVGTNRIIYDGNKTPGMLFIGDYTGTTSTAFADGSISIDKGREFRNRPTRLSFYYTYAPYGGEGMDTFDARIELHDTDGNIIAEGYFSSSSSMSDYSLATIELDYGAYTLTVGDQHKAAKIFVIFQSSTAGGNIPFGKDHSLILGDEGNKSTHYGSVLRIDDISLIYDK